jgi:hypothetical protein
MPVFTYNVQTEDLIELGLYRFRTDPRLRLQARGFQILVPLVIFLASIGTVYLLDSDKQLMPIDWIVPCVLAVVMVIIFPRSFESNIRKRVAAQFKEGPGKELAGRHTANITPELVIQTSKANELRAPWGAIRQIAITDERIFLFVDDSQAMVIPRQGFTNAKQYDQAKALVTQYQRKPT